MARQHATPDGGYLNEARTNQHAVASGGYVDESVSTPAGTPLSNSQKFRFYYAPLLTPTPRLSKLRQNSNFALAPPPPPPPPPPYHSRRKQYFPTQPTYAQGALRQRRYQSQVNPQEPNPLFVDNVMRQVLVSGTGTLQVDALYRQVLVQNSTTLLVDAVLRQALVTNPPQAAPYPVFPTLPQGFPVKIRPIMSSIVDINPWSAREMRFSKQPVPLWEFDLTFEELRDQTPNAVPYALFLGLLQYQQLVQHFLMMYGTGSLFLFSAPWDNSRFEQPLAVGDGKTYIYTAMRTWGQDPNLLIEPVGAINTITDIKINGVTVNPAHYYFVGNRVIFQGADGTLYPPANGAGVGMSFSYYYLCRFANNEQEFEMFMKNRWLVKTLTIRSTIPASATP